MPQDALEVAWEKEREGGGEREREREREREDVRDAARRLGWETLHYGWALGGG